MLGSALVVSVSWPCCLLKCSAKIPAQSEDEPIGWFELESEWNDTEIQLQQCRVAKVGPVLNDLTLNRGQPFLLATCLLWNKRYTLFIYIMKIEGGSFHQGLLIFLNNVY